MRKLFIIALMMSTVGCARMQTGLDAGAWSICNYPYPYMPNGLNDKCGRLYHELVVSGRVVPPPNYQAMRESHGNG
jgi:hypothetical protein